MFIYTNGFFFLILVNSARQVKLDLSNHIIFLIIEQTIVLYSRLYKTILCYINKYMDVELNFAMTLMHNTKNQIFKRNMSMFNQTTLDMLSTKY